jgi:hypothetical protein
MPIQIPFTRRTNPDATIDSICMGCYRTVAPARCEADLTSADQGHVCDPAELETYRSESLQGTF